jgi:hypothetical protein
MNAGREHSLETDPIFMRVLQYSDTHMYAASALDESG